MHSPTTNRKENFAALTGLRVIGAWYVYLHHFPDWGAKFGQAGYRLALEGHVGVTLFFVLSGFLIAWNYRPEVTYAKYLSRRLARVMPLYVSVLVFGLLFARETNLGEWISQLFLIRGVNGPPQPPGIAQSWTLTVEVCFYLSAPALIGLGRRHSYLKTLLGVYATGATLAALLAGFGTDHFAHWIGRFANYTFFGRAFEFLVGAALADRLAQARGAEILTCKASLTTWGVLASVAAVSAMASFERIENGDWRNTVINNWVLSSAFALLILGLVREPRSWLARLLATPLFGLLGRASYAFYLIHLGPLSTIIRNGLKGLPGSSILTFVVLNILSIALLYVIEEPARKIIERLPLRLGSRRKALADLT